MNERYAVRLIQDKKVLKRIRNDDLKYLIASLVNDLENKFPDALGIIRDNKKRKVISRLKKSTIED